MIQDHSDHGTSKEPMGAFHYAKDSGNFGRKSHGKVHFGSFRPEYSGSPLEVLDFDQSNRSDRNLQFHFDTNRFIALHLFPYEGNLEKE